MLSLSTSIGRYLRGHLESTEKKASFDLKPFFDAASEAGIYLIARPGPYINAEASGGGFPGWLQRCNGTLRNKRPSLLESDRQVR